jgi:hypothetical protein
VLPSTPAFKQLVGGVKADPVLAGLMRSLLLYVLPLAIGAATAYVQGWTDPRLLPLVPIALGAIRWAESAIDKLTKPDQNRPNPPPVAGGGDADLLT